MGIWAFIISSLLFLWKCEAFYNKKGSPNSYEFSLIGFPKHFISFWYGVGWGRSGKKLSVIWVDQQRLPGQSTATLILNEVGTLGECAFWIQPGKGLANCTMSQKYCIVWWKNIFKILTFFSHTHSHSHCFFFFFFASLSHTSLCSFCREKAPDSRKKNKGSLFLVFGCQKQRLEENRKEIEFPRLPHLQTSQGRGIPRSCVPDAF